MATGFKPRYVELRALLEQYDINANRVKEEGMSEEGYHYVRERSNGQPIYKTGTFELDTIFVPWPNKEVYERVLELYYGTPADGPKEPEIKASNPGPRGKEKITKKKDAE